MNEAEIPAAVAAKLAGGFYVGQRLRLIGLGGQVWTGVVVAVDQYDVILHEANKPGVTASYSKSLLRVS